MTPIYFDIETGPLPREELERLMPEFTAARNLKDPEKITADIANKKQAWFDNAALNPLTGRILVCGLKQGSRFIMLDGVSMTDGGERIILQEFWGRWSASLPKSTTFVGFNIYGFDLPFMVRRSWVLGVPVPADIMIGRYWNKRLVDLQEVWQLGDRHAPGSLGDIAKGLGIGEKQSNGAEFARLYSEDPAQALKYLENDLELTQKVAEVLLSGSVLA